jgi:hypothetical protein
VPDCDLTQRSIHGPRSSGGSAIRMAAEPSAPQGQVRQRFVRMASIFLIGQELQDRRYELVVVLEYASVSGVGVDGQLRVG